MNNEKYQKRRNEILSAAFDVFAEKGYHITKISDIAKRLDMGHGTFYRYFRNKLDIFSSVIDEIFSGIVNVITREPPTKANTAEEYRDQLITIGNNLTDVFKKDIRMARILFYEVLGVDPGINEKFDRAMALLDEYAEAYLINGIDKGFIKNTVNTRLVAKAMNAMIFASIKDTLIAEDPVRLSREWTQTISMLILDGVKL